MNPAVPPPRIALLPDSGPGVGLGHVSRCLSLGRAAAALGAHVRLVAGPDACAASLVRSTSLEIVAVATVNGEGAIDRLRQIETDAVVVDSYRASARLFAELRSVAASVIAVDDLADRSLPVDVVVNGGVAAEELPYLRAPGIRFLLGPGYALLDPCYAASPAPRTEARVRRVLVTLGGGRHGDDLRVALAVLDDTLTDVDVDVVVGPGGGDAELTAAASVSPHRVRIHENSAGLRELIAAADLAISGSGMTLYELAATATPTVAVCMADNQRPNFEAFPRAGAAIAGGRAGEAGLRASLAAATARLGADAGLRRRLGERGRALVDGQGAERVARAIGEAVVALR
jgi:spore coat polysaccharide biosynthesis predicted glycosyltransferase SpsG